MIFAPSKHTPAIIAHTSCPCRRQNPSFSTRGKTAAPSATGAAAALAPKFTDPRRDTSTSLNCSTNTKSAFRLSSFVFCKRSANRPLRTRSLSCEVHK